VGRPAVQSVLLAALDLESEFGGNDDLSAERGECFADQFFVKGP
jgi:hypothetical protein